MFLAKSE